MSDIPAGWYDNPEQPTQYRYWDGTAWTDHISPKAPPRPNHHGESVWEVVSAMFSLVGRCWQTLLLVLLPLIALSLIGAALVYAGFEAALSPDLGDIIERVADPDFDTANPADEAFIDSIEFDAGGSSIVSWVLGGAVFVAATVLQALVVTVHLASAVAGRRLGVGATYRSSLRRLPRVVGISLLWAIGAAIVACVVMLLFIVGVLAPLFFIVLIPALLAAVIFIWPYGQIAVVKLLAGPTHEPPLRGAIAFVNGRWGALAIRMLVLTVVLFAVSFAVGVVNAPISAASVVAGFVAGWILQTVQSVLATAGNVVVYDWGGGEYDETILAPVSPETAPV